MTLMQHLCSSHREYLGNLGVCAGAIYDLGTALERPGRRLSSRLRVLRLLQESRHCLLLGVELQKTLCPAPTSPLSARHLLCSGLPLLLQLQHRHF